VTAASGPEIPEAAVEAALSSSCKGHNHRPISGVVVGLPAIHERRSPCAECALAAAWPHAAWLTADTWATPRCDTYRRTAPPEVAAWLRRLADEALHGETP